MALAELHPKTGCLSELAKTPPKFQQTVHFSLELSIFLDIEL
jgi:hypothetical protein